MIYIGNYKRNIINLYKDSGIYCITNKINNKKYIGQSYSITNRWYRHKNELKNNCHHNKHLQSAWNKYGNDNFEFSILEYCPLELLNSKEQYWIQYYDSFKGGYNQTSGDIGCRGYKHSESEIQKMRAIYNPKTILQLNNSLEIIREWASCCQVSMELGLYRQSITDCCTKCNRVKSVGGYIWVYKEDYKNIDKEYYLIKDIQLPKLVGQFDAEFNLIKIWNSCYEINKKSDFDSSTINQVCNHKRNSYNGYIWAFVNDDGEILDDYDYSKIKIRSIRSIGQYDTDGNLINTYSSLKDAQNKTKFDKHYIADVCNGMRKTYKNYIWKYA